MPLVHRLHILILEHAVKIKRPVSVAEVADASGVSRQTLYNWMDNKRLKRIDTEVVEKLCRYFDISFHELFEVVDDTDN